MLDLMCKVPVVLVKICLDEISMRRSTLLVTVGRAAVSFYCVELAKLLLWRNVLSGVNEHHFDCIKQQYIRRHITAPLESSCLQSATHGCNTLFGEKVRCGCRELELPSVTHLLAGQSVKKVESAVCHVQTRYCPLWNVMWSQGPSCDARTEKHMLLHVFKSIYCHLYRCRIVRCDGA